METIHALTHHETHNLTNTSEAASSARQVAGQAEKRMKTDHSVRFWDRIANYYSRSPIADEAVYQKKLEVTREYFHPDMAVLEFGCGTGSTAIAHAPYVQHIHATDLSSRMIEIAQKKADENNIENVTFEQLSIDELSQANESLDAVLGLSILHLVEDKDEVIDKVHRMLRPGGVFVSSTACLGDTMKFFKIIGTVGKFLRILPLIKVFTTRQLENSLIKAGFRIEYQWQPGKGKAIFIVAKRPG